MGVRGCYSCMKYLFVFLNIIFLLLAVIGIAAATWMFVDPTFPLQLTQEPNDYVISIVILLIASIILLIVGILGIYSSLGEVRCAIVMCFSLLLVIVVAEVSAGVWGYLNREFLEIQIRSAVKNSVQDTYIRDEKVRVLFDTFQEKLQCCGAEKPSDWSQTSTVDMVISSQAEKYNIPKSCCRAGISPEQCHKATTDIKLTQAVSNDIYEKGCYTLILAKIRDSVCIILGVGGAILAVQLLGLILALCLAFTMNRSNRFKG